MICSLYVSYVYHLHFPPIRKHPTLHPLFISQQLKSAQGPAISFAYEKAESAVMLRPPRNLQKDRLISRGLLIYAYSIAGLTNMVRGAELEILLSH